MAALFIARRRNARRERIFRERVTDLDAIPDDIIKDRYRLTRPAIVALERRLRDDLTPQTERSKAISSMTKVSAHETRLY